MVHATGEQTRTCSVSLTGERDDDEPPDVPDVGEIIIRKPWDAPRNVARRFWPEVLAPRPRVQRMCAHCGERPAALAEWRPHHQMFDLLCVQCRVTVYQLASRISWRRHVDVRHVLDSLMLVMWLVQH